MKRLMLFLTILAVGISHAYAYDFSAVAPTGQTLFYTFSGSGNVQVTYEVAPSSISPTSPPSCSNLTGALEIPSSVTFQGTTYSVTSIGSYAFSCCSGLTGVTIPSSVTSIDSYAFAYCGGLTSVTIPSSVTSISDGSFIGCGGLTSISVAAGNTRYDSRNNCNAIIQTSTNTLIAGCQNTSIPNTVTSIGNYAFYDCSGLTSVTIPSSVTSIGSYAFFDCSGLTSISVAAGNTRYDSRNNCNAIIQTSTNKLIVGCKNTDIPNTVTSIDNYAFYGCSGLTSVTIPSSVTSIGSYAFYGCSGLTSISVAAGNYYYDSRNNCNAIIQTSNNKLIVGCKNTDIPNTVTSIDNYAFYGCGASIITVPNSVTYIGSYAFSGVRCVICCSSISGSPWGANMAGCYFVDGDFVFEDSTHSVLRAYIGSDSAVAIPSSVTSIGSSAFSGCSALTSVTIPSSVTFIGESAFYGCSGLTSVTIPSSVTSIGGRAFYDCSGLTNVVFNAQNCTTMGFSSGYYEYESVFSGCSNFASLTIGDSVRTIPAFAFYGCSGLTNVTIGNSVTSIGDGIFAGCSSLTSVTIPSSVTSIGANAFSGCSGLTEITAEGVTAPLLGEYAFSGVNSTIPVNIPCGRMLSYMSRWSYFSNFVEGAGYSFDATSSNPAMGYVVVLTQPTCTAPQAVVNAVAIPGYIFDHWSNGSTANPYSFNLSQNTSLVAYFAEAVRDTVFIHDTTFVDNYIHDTTIVNNYIYDTTFVDNYIHDTTIVNNYIYDTTFVDVFIHDTTVLTEWIYDTTYVDLWHYDTIVVQQELTYYNISVLSENNARGLVAGNGRFPDGTEIEIAAIPIEGSQFLQWDDGNSDNPRTVTVSSDLTFVATFDAATQSVTDVEAVKHTINVSGCQIIVNNAAGDQIRIFDVIGRCLSTTNSLEQVRVFNMPASGVYMVQVGSYPAQKVVVVQ